MCVEETAMKKNFRLVRSNLKLARAIWGGLPKTKLDELRALEPYPREREIILEDTMKRCPKISTLSGEQRTTPTSVTGGVAPISQRE
jgi:hypothetical protein